MTRPKMMLPKGKTERRWRKAAEAAISPERLAAERESLAAELARRVWAANGGPAWVSAEDEGSLVVLETLVAPFLRPDVLRAVAGFKYLQQVEETLQRADYEDVPGLQAERLWADQYLTEMVFREEPSGAAARGASFAGEVSMSGDRESAALRLERLYRELTASVQAKLKAAEIAA